MRSILCSVQRSWGGALCVEKKVLIENSLGVFRQKGAGCYSGQPVRDVDVRDGQGMGLLVDISYFILTDKFLREVISGTACSRG